MKTKFIALVLGALLTIPCVLRAEEIEIHLEEVIQMGTSQLNPGDNPLDGNDHLPPNPTRPNDFRATIDFHTLTVTKLNSSIPSANAIVINVQTGSAVINRHFFTSMTEQISTPGVYVLYIQTLAGGNTLIGQFIVQ